MEPGGRLSGATYKRKCRLRLGEPPDQQTGASSPRCAASGSERRASGSSRGGKGLPGADSADPPSLKVHIVGSMTRDELDPMRDVVGRGWAVDVSGRACRVLVGVAWKVWWELHNRSLRVATHPLDLPYAALFAGLGGALHDQNASTYDSRASSFFVKLEELTAAGRPQ